MADPIRRGQLAQQLNRQSSVQVEALGEDVECVVWRGPVGESDTTGVPSAWSPGFILDEVAGLEAIILPKTIVDEYQLNLSFGFWGARPGAHESKSDEALSSIPHEIGLTETDQETLGKQTPGTRRPDATANRLIGLRKKRMQIINDYATRVRIIGLDPDIVTYPRPEEWDVLAIGMFPVNVRFGLLIPRPDPSGERWKSGPGTVPVWEHRQATNAAIEAPKNAPTPMAAQVQSIRAQSRLEDVRAGVAGGGGGFPEKGATVHTEKLQAEQVEVKEQGEQDPASTCPDGG